MTTAEQAAWRLLRTRKELRRIVGGRGTRDQIANIRWIMEKAREFQKNINFCFINYVKAFDCVDYNKLWQVLKEMGVPDYLTCLLRNLYVCKEATVRTGHGTTDWFKTGKGVRQGHIWSPCLFNSYAEYIMQNARLDESQTGIKIARRNNSLRYANDTTLMAESELKHLLMRVKEDSTKVGLKLNIKKTKIIASGPITTWQIEGEAMEIVTDFITADETVIAETQKKIIDAFEVFDHECNKTVDVREIGTIIRSLGCCPSEGELHDMLAEVEEEEPTGFIRLEKFLPMMTRVLMERRYRPIPEDVLLRAFEVLDQNKCGHLTKDELIKYMTEEGEPFTQEEMEEMLSAAVDPETNTVRYKDYISMMVVDEN
ncbi:Dynein regulatory complex protein 8 [Varanus komodoensis]|nr:Dynein regulatory complex protein 8 [Varanus komodoensis]